MRKSSTYRSVQDRVKCGPFWGALLRDGHGRLVLLAHRAHADPEEDGGGHHRCKREREGVVHEVELASSHREHHGFRRVVGVGTCSSVFSRSFDHQPPVEVRKNWRKLDEAEPVLFESKVAHN